MIKALSRPDVYQKRGWLKTFPLDCLIVHLMWLEFSFQIIRCRSGRGHFVWFCSETQRRGSLRVRVWPESTPSGRRNPHILAFAGRCYKVTSPYYASVWTHPCVRHPWPLALNQRRPGICQLSVWEPSAAYSHAGDLLQQKWRQLSAPDCVNVILTVNHCHSRTFSSIALPAHCVTSSGGYADRLQPSFHLAPGPFITCSRNFLKLL